MSETAQNKPVLPLNPPKALLILSVPALLLAWFISPERLIDLGPLRTSLQSELDGVQDIARLEVFLFRIGMLLGGLGFGFLFVRWKQFLNWRVVRAVSARSPKPIGRQFGLSFGICAFFLVISGIYIFIAESVFTNAQLSLIHREEGVIESATAIIFFLCSIAALFLAKKKLSAKTYTHAAFACLMAFGFFLFAGEEISWGQRIFDLEVIEYFEENNVQGENNIHNLFGYLADHLFILGVFTYGFVMPLLAWRSPFLSKLFDSLGLPIASLGLGIGFLLISMIHNWTIYRVVDPVPGLRIAELREMLSSIGFALLMYETWKNTKLFQPE